MKSTSLHRDELAKDVFLSLLDRWDIKDRSGAIELAHASFEIAEALIEVRDATIGAKVKARGGPAEVV